MTAEKAIVIGGSLAGLMAGIALRRGGWDVHLHERSSSDHHSRGRGLLLEAETLHALEAIGAEYSRHDASPSTVRLLLDAAGEVVNRVSVDELFTSWNAVYAHLRASFPADRYHPRSEVVGLDQDATVVTATLASGETICGDLLIGADGIGSTVRRTLLPPPGRSMPASLPGGVWWRNGISRRQQPIW